jgi:hypothetical protein
MTSTAPESRRRNLWPIALVVAGLAASTFYLDRRLAESTARIGRLEHEITRTRQVAELLRVESSSKGKGIGAIVEQIEYWGPLVASAGTPHSEAVKIEGRLDEAIEAVGVLGRDAFATLRDRLGREPALDLETRRWFLRAAIRADRAQGLELASRIARGTDFAPNPQVRLSAVRELLATDRQLGGLVLHQIVTVESARGVTRQPDPAIAPDYERGIPTNASEHFFNFIPLYANSGHPEVEITLRQLLARPEHDLLTILECVRELGRLRSKESAPKIRELFDQPPGRTFNPMFQNSCLQALADIEGSALCPWLQEKLRTETTPLVAARLQELVKQLCN